MKHERQSSKRVKGIPTAKCHQNNKKKSGGDFMEFYEDPSLTSADQMFS